MSLEMIYICFFSFYSAVLTQINGFWIDLFKITYFGFVSYYY